MARELTERPQKRPKPTTLHPENEQRSFKQFVRDPAQLRNSWIREPGLNLYVRRSLPTNVQRFGVSFDLANMNADEPGKGALTRFLDRYEGEYKFYIESVLNVRLRLYFQRRGYEFVDKTICMVRP